MDNPRCFVEQTGTPSGKARPSSCKRQILAREPERHDIARRQVVRPRCADIIQRHHIRPFRRQQFAALGVFFDVGHDGTPSPFEAEVKAADTGKK